MATEQIGLEAVLQDANFQAGLKRYISGLSDAEKKTDSAASGITKSLSGFGRDFVRLGDGVWDFAGRVGQAMGIAGIAIAGVGALITKSALDIAGDYQASMNVLQATTGASGDQMAKLGVLAKELGADMTLPATSAADAGIAMTEMAKAGLAVNDILGASKGVLQLSAAANISNAEAAMITVNALKAFNLEGDQATRVADLLTAAATSSGSSITEMGMAFQMGAAVATQAGVGIEDFTTMLAEMSQAGIKGSDAGTSIKTMLLRLIAPTDTAAAEMQKLGVNIYDASGKMLPINDIMRDMNSALFGTAQVMTTVGGRTAEQDARLKSLKSTQAGLVKQYENLSAGISGAGMAEDKRRAKLAELAWEINQAGGAINSLNGIQGTATQVTKKLSEEERNAALMTIFGTDAIRAASIVVGKGSEAFDTMRDKVTQSGKAADMAGARMKGFKGVLAGIKSQAETALLAFAEPMLGPLEDIGRKIADVFGKPETMEAIQRFGELIGKNIADALTFVSDAIAGFQAGGVGGLMTALGITPESQAMIQGVFDFIVANLPAITGALAGLGVVLGGAALVSAIAAIGTAIAAIGAPVLALVAASALLGAAWSADWGGIRTTLTQVWNDTLQPALAQLWAWLQVNIPIAIQTLSNFWNTILLPALQVIWTFISEQVFPLFGVLWAWLQETIPAAIQVLTDFWTNTLLPAITMIWEFVSTQLIPLFVDLANLLAVIVSKALEGLTGLWRDVFYPVIKTIWDFIDKNLIPIFKDVARVVVDVLGAAFEWARINILNPFIEGLTFILGYIDDIRQAIRGLTNALAGVKLPGAGGGTTPTGSEFQEGGYVPFTQRALIHGGEFVLSKTMLKELSSILSSQATMAQSMVQSVGGGMSTTNNRTVNVTVNPTYEQYQSPSAIRYDIAAALVAAGV